MCLNKIALIYKMKNRYLALFIFISFYSCSNKSERIIFSSSRDGNSNIYSMEADGTDLQPITSDSTEEWGPSIMPSGEISFLRQTSHTIIRIAIDPASKKDRYLAHPQNCLLDDKNVLYNQVNNWQLYACEGTVFVADSMGAIIYQPTQDLSGKAYKAVWFPDAQKIAFTYKEEGQSDIYTVNLDGAELKNITNSPYNEEAPAISPDGTRLLYSTNQDGNNNQEIYLMDLNTGETINMTQTPDWELIARWSSDGKAVYFGSNKEGNWELYKYELATKKTSRLTNSPSFDGDPRVYSF